MEEIMNIRCSDGFYLNMKVLKPIDNYKAKDRTCIVFYFGGGFLKRNLKHFQRQAEYFCELGVVCVLADYRLVSEGNGLQTCCQDAIDVLKNVELNSDILGIDRKKIIVCGGSAGGMLACWCSMKTKIPSAQVLFNPVLFFHESRTEYITQNEIIVQINDEKHELKKVDDFKESWGMEFTHKPELFSAYHLLDKYEIPSTLILQGTADPIAYPGVVLFHQRAQEKQANCHTIFYRNEPHGFFNYDNIENKFCYYDTLKRMESFLMENGYI